ncbi:MAG: hypothetical protein LCH41_10005 [Armatimonadetes bacterium]|nr:hypothetical protein [Armatimonadota bacterium]
MNSRITQSLAQVLLVTMMASTTGCVAQASQGSNEVKESWVFKLLGAEKPVVDAALGKSKKDEDFEIYSKNNMTIRALFVDGRYLGTCSMFTVEFRKNPGSWKNALKELQIDPTGVKAEVPTDTGIVYPAGYMELKQIKSLPEKWRVSYIPEEKGKDSNGVPYSAGARIAFSR